MKFLYPSAVSKTIGVFFGALALFLPSIRSLAQPTTTPTVAAALLQPLHLHPSATTLRALLAALTKQTGIMFTAQNCLLDRVMTLSADGQTGHDVLSALVDLYDWRWVQTEDGRIYISRQPLPRITTLPEVQAAVRRSLSTDFKRYLGIGVSIGSLPPPRTERARGCRRLK